MHAHWGRFQSTHSSLLAARRSSIVWFIRSAFLQSCLIINRWCQRVAGLSVWQGISINTNSLSISICNALLTFNYGCINVCYRPLKCVCVHVWATEKVTFFTGYETDDSFFFFFFKFCTNLSQTLENNRRIKLNVWHHIFKRALTSRSAKQELNWGKLHFLGWPFLGWLQEASPCPQTSRLQVCSLWILVI